MNSTLTRTEMLECPLCGKLHQVELRKRNASATVKGETVSYQEQYYLCKNIADDDNEFVPARMMDANLLEVRDAYRRSHRMLTSKDLVALRNRYKLTQRELAKLLGWGEATISRYETKLIQDKTYDDILKRIDNDPTEVKRFLSQNRDSFDSQRFNEIMLLVDQEIAETSQIAMDRRILEEQYARMNAGDDYTGGVMLDIPKTCAMIAFFASRCRSLYKVKTMKMLWYADSVSYRDYGHSMSGLVYRHMPMGALPVGHTSLISIVPHEEQYEPDSDFEHAQFKILPTEGFSESVFSREELSVLERVLSKFSSFSGKDLAEYMHREIAYRQTADRAFIPFSLAKLVTI